MKGLKFVRPSRPYGFVLRTPSGLLDARPRWVQGDPIRELCEVFRAEPRTEPSRYEVTQDLRQLRELRIPGWDDGFAVWDVPSAESCKLPPCTTRRLPCC